MTAVARARIEQLVPHAGAMCLLDSVTQWGAAGITCTGAAPDAAHALAREGRVSAIVAVEYAAQAAAVHGALLDETAAPRPGLLATLLDVELRATQFDALGGAALVAADLLSRSAQGCLYGFEVTQAGAAVAQGRLVVAFPAEARP
jgi:predicted hotdog family 3-hydroxylacyl-ACP dehydratase